MGPKSIKAERDYTSKAWQRRHVTTTISYGKDF